MNYNCELKETLHDYGGTLYKMILLKIECVDGRLQHMALPFTVVLESGAQSASSCINLLSGDEKTLSAYFTVDALGGLSAPATAKLGYGGHTFDEIAGIDPQNPEPIPPHLAAIPHSIADNAWLASML